MANVRNAGLQHTALCVADILKPNLTDSTVMTKLVRNEDKRRDLLPPQFVFRLYMPPDNFIPGKEAVCPITEGAHDMCMYEQESYL